MASFVPTKQFVGASSSSDIGSSRLVSLQLPSKFSSSNFHLPSRPSQLKRLGTEIFQFNLKIYELFTVFVSVAHLHKLK